MINPLTLQYLLFALILIVLVLSAVIIYLLRNEDYKSKEPGSKEKIIKKAEQASDTIIERAVTRAQQILSSAQLKRISFLSTEKQIGRQITDLYRRDIEKLEAELREQFEKNTLSADKTYQEFISSVEKKIQDSLDKNRKTIEEKASVFIDSAATSLTEFTSELEKNIKNQIESEMKKTRMEIEEYKTQREKIIDEKIIDILEEVFRKTIDKKLTLSDQSDFVYQALEEAKNSHAFR